MSLSVLKSESEVIQDKLRDIIPKLQCMRGKISTLFNGLYADDGVGDYWGMSGQIDVALAILEDLPEELYEIANELSQAMPEEWRKEHGFDSKTAAA